MTLPMLMTLFSGALAVCVGLLVDTGLEFLLVYLTRGLAVIRERRLGKPRPATTQAGPLTLDELYGVAHVSWAFWMAIAAAAGATLTVAFVPASFGVFRLLGASIGVAPMFVRGYMRDTGRKRVQAQVRNFITDLRLALAIDGSMARTLQRVRRRGKGILYERLGLYVDTRLTSESGHEVLRLLAGDLRSPEFDDLMFRLQAATRGAKSYEAALAEAAERVANEMYGRTMRGLKAAPVRLIIPVIVTLFAPTIVLGMYPLVARVIAGLGANPTGW